MSTGLTLYLIVGELHALLGLHQGAKFGVHEHNAKLSGRGIAALGTIIFVMICVWAWPLVWPLVYLIQRRKKGPPD